MARTYLASSDPWAGDVQAVASVRQGPGAFPETEEMRPGNEGRQQLMDRIATEIAKGAKKWRIRNLARQILRSANVHPYDIHGQCDAFFNFCRDSLPYVLDGLDVQEIQTAEELLTLLGADCKGKTLLFLMLAQSVGINCWPCTVDQNPGEGEPNDHHIYGEVEVEGVDGAKYALPADPVLGNVFGKSARFGTELKYRRKTRWEVRPL